MLMQEIHELKGNLSALQAQLADQQKAASEELLLTKQALADVTAAKQKTTQVLGHKLTLAALHAVRCKPSKLPAMTCEQHPCHSSPALPASILCYGNGLACCMCLLTGCLCQRIGVALYLAAHTHAGVHG